jgi:Mrp family chromosome partitioning ATPase
LARLLGLAPAKRSLADALQDPCLTLEDIVEPLPRFNLAVVSAGRPEAVPYEMLASPRLEGLLDEARPRYDFIVLDAPPFVPVPDCRLFAKCVDGFVVVVATHRTPRSALAETLNLIDPAKMVGLVFNGDVARRSSYYDVAGPASVAARWRRPWRTS